MSQINNPEQLVRDVWGLKPQIAPFKERGGASEEAAKAIGPAAGDLRGLVARAFFDTYPNACTADEIAAQLRVTVLSCRPRVSELRAVGLIEPSGERRRNRTSNQTATAWVATSILMGINSTQGGQS